VVIGKIQELASRPDLIRPFLAREIKRRKVAQRDREHRAGALERRLADLEARQGRLVDWLAETLPGKAAARKINEKIERLEEEKKKLAEELAETERAADEDFDGVTAEAVARHLAEFGYYLDQFNAGQRKELLEAVVQTVTVEGPARARLRLDLPIRPLGRFDRVGSKWCPVWRPQRDEDPNGIPAEFVITLDHGRTPTRKHSSTSGRRHFKAQRSSRPRAPARESIKDLPGEDLQDPTG
jgi:hypothetical protein